MSVQVRKVAGFDQVRFRGPGVLKITQGNEESLTVHAPAYVMKYIAAEVRDGTLRLGYVSPKIVSLKVRKEVISYQLKLRDLSRIVSAGSGKIVVPDIDNDVFRIEVNGSGQVSLENLTADRLEVVLNGSGEVMIAGDIESQSLIVHGSGRYHAERLISDFASVRIAGAGQAHVSVTDDLNVVIRGSGRVSYAGYPDISKVISGAGRLTRRRREKTGMKRGEEHG